MAEDPRARRTPYVPSPRATAEPPGGGEPVAGATAAEMARRRFGRPTRVQSRAITLSATWGQILESNPRRLFWTIINRGVVNAAVDTDASATFANGILLGAAGGFASMDVEEDGETVGWTVYGAAESGTAVVRAVEVMSV